MGDLSNTARGRWGEAQAERHLRRAGFGILARNWRSPEKYIAGDLDLIARRGDLTVVCEVKARRSAGFGGAAAAVTHVKQQQIRRLTESWVRIVGADVDHLRFDVIAIEGVRLTHLEGAF